MPMQRVHPPAICTLNAPPSKVLGCARGAFLAQFNIDVQGQPPDIDVQGQPHDKARL